MVNYHDRNPRVKPYPFSFSGHTGRIDSTMHFARLLGQLKLRVLIYSPSVRQRDRFWINAFSMLAYRQLWLVPFFAMLLPLLVGARVPLLWCVGISTAITGVAIAVSWYFSREPLAASHGVELYVYAPRRRDHDAEIVGDSDLFEQVARYLHAAETADVAEDQRVAAWHAAYSQLEQTRPRRERSTS